MTQQTRKPRKIKTIDIQAFEWFDKVNGNSYFSALITLNYGLKSQYIIKLPFQYGYGDTYRHEAFKTLQNLGYFLGASSYWTAYNDYKIIARHSKQENCKKSVLKNI